MRLLTAQQLADALGTRATSRRSSVRLVRIVSRSPLRRLTRYADS